jgi:chemotaxis signal transduction protein
VQDTLEIDESEVQAPLATLQGKLAGFTKGQVAHGNDILVYLDVEKILQCEEMRILRKA